MGFGQVFAVGAFTLEQVGHGIDAEAVDAAVQPKGHDAQDFPAHGRIVVIEIGLMAVKAVPVVLLGDGVPGPVGVFGVLEDDACACW